VERYGHTDPTTGLNSRFLDFLAVLDEVVEFALHGDIDLVLFCGDAYKSQHPDPTQQREFAKRIAKIAQDIPIFLLVGNHDLPHAIGKATTVEIFDTLSLRNVTIARRPGVYSFHTKGGQLQILALPWARQAALLSREETRGLSIDQIDAKLQEVLTGIVQGLTSDLDPDIPTIMAAHFSLDTAKPGSERTMLLGREPVLLQSNIIHHPFSYVALGHIHHHQVLNQHPPIIYCGSLERLDFSEEGDEKGFYVVDINGKDATFSFHPVKARHFITLKFTMDAPQLNPMATILRGISLRAKEVKDAIVRVEISLPTPEAKIEEKEIRRALSEAYFVSSISVQAQGVKPSTRWEGVEGLTTLDALRRYLELRKTPPPWHQKLLEYGERLIEETSD